jgi:UDP-2-acetamido-2,6-beta-L-arabino-hexul-4-ose reductase
MSLLYVDDAVEAMLRILALTRPPSGVLPVGPIYSTTLGEVVAQLQSFVESRHTLVVPHVGAGLTRALYATYVSFLPPEAFAYPLERHADPRGSFVEILRTPDCGQVSYFTALPGVTRGEHYHHTKTEKFLVVKGAARFGFRHVVSGETFAIEVDGDAARIVETVPGWAHNVTNIGASEMIVMLWANETFDRQRPDTVASRVGS